MLNRDDFCGPTSDQQFAAKSNPSMMPESQHACSVNAKLNKHIIVHCFLIPRCFFSFLDTAPYAGHGVQPSGKLTFAK